MKFSKSMKKRQIYCGSNSWRYVSDKRLFIIKDFKKINLILVSSDITSRGIHVDNVSLVINYEVQGIKTMFTVWKTGR